MWFQCCSCWRLLAPNQINQQLKSTHDMLVWDEHVAKMVWKRAGLQGKKIREGGSMLPASKNSSQDHSISFCVFWVHMVFWPVSCLKTLKFQSWKWVSAKWRLLPGKSRPLPGNYAPWKVQILPSMEACHATVYHTSRLIRWSLALWPGTHHAINNMVMPQNIWLYMHVYDCVCVFGNLPMYIYIYNYIYMHKTIYIVICI